MMTAKNSEVYSGGGGVGESGFDTLQNEHGLLKLGSLKRERGEQCSDNIILHTDNPNSRVYME